MLISVIYEENEVIALETTRIGIRGDTFDEFLN